MRAKVTEITRGRTFRLEVDERDLRYIREALQLAGELEETDRAQFDERFGEFTSVEEFGKLRNPIDEALDG